LFTGDVVLGQLRRSAGVRVHEHGQPRGSGHTEPRVPHAASLARGCGDIRGVWPIPRPRRGKL